MRPSINTSGLIEYHDSPKRVTVTFRFTLLIVSLLSLWNCAPPTKLNVIIHMMPAQEEYFRERVIKNFEKEYHCIVNVKHYDDPTRLPYILDSAKGQIDLVKTPFEMTHILSEKGLMAAVDEIGGPQGMVGVKEDYFLMDLVKSNNHYYYLPRKFETRMLIYLKSKVQAAYEVWPNYKNEINETLKKYNSYGLPSTYEFEADPAQWDFFDLFTAGYIWSRKEFGGVRKARIAHRAKRYPGTALGLLDRAYSLGASQNAILRMDADPVVDMFRWNAVLVKEKLLNPKMFDEQWAGAEIWKGFGNGEVFLSDMTQIDAFFIHGVGTSDMPGFLKNPDDMGVAVMPKGMSLDLDPEGVPLRVGKRSVTTGGWWWGIPKSSSKPEWGFKLARYITNTQNQIEECSTFGMVPVRQDILQELGLMFGGGWMTQVFNVAAQQLVENKYTTVPMMEEYWQVGENYMDAYYDICVKGLGQDISFNTIKKVLQERYVPKEQAILKKKYPDRP